MGTIFMVFGSNPRPPKSRGRHFTRLNLIQFLSPNVNIYFVRCNIPHKRKALLMFDKKPKGSWVSQVLTRLDSVLSTWKSGYSAQTIIKKKKLKWFVQVMSSVHVEHKLASVCAALRVAGLSSFSALLKVTLGVFLSSPQPCQKKRWHVSDAMCRGQPWSLWQDVESGRLLPVRWRGDDWCCPLDVLTAFQDKKKKTEIVPSWKLFQESLRRLKPGCFHSKCISQWNDSVRRAIGWADISMLSAWVKGIFKLYCKKKKKNRYH